MSRNGTAAELELHDVGVRWTSSWWLRLGLKRLVDLLVGGVGLVVSMPLLVVVAFAIYVDSGSPVLFRARRIGRHGKVYTMYKFRTMIPDAAMKLVEISHLNIGDGMVKIPNDPRVTRVGARLRRYSVDELPQLWNVISGNMSLVGPRPHDATEMHLKASDMKFRFSIRPGLTGLWQVKGRNDPSLAHRVHYDLVYLREASPLLDLKILLWTIPTVLKGQGGIIEERPVAELATEPALAYASPYVGAEYSDA